MRRLLAVTVALLLLQTAAWTRSSPWAVAWATESLQQAVASHAYPGSLTNGRTKINAHAGEQPILAPIASPTKTAYTQAHKATASDQVVRASVRLANLLNAIAWQ